MKKEICVKRGEYQDSIYLIVNKNSITVKNYWVGGQKYETRELQLPNASFLSDALIIKFYNLSLEIEGEIKRNREGKKKRKIASSAFEVKWENRGVGYFVVAGKLSALLSERDVNPEITSEKFYDHKDNLAKAREVVETWN